MIETQEQSGDRQPEADIALIRNMMMAGRKRAGVDGAHLVLWGALLMGTFLMQYSSVVGYIPKMGPALWGGMMIIGWLGSFYLGRKIPRAHCEHNIALTGYTSAWLAVGITMAAYFITSTLSGQPDNRTITVLSAGTFGSAFFVISHVLNVKLLRFVAVGWWAIMVYMVQLKNFDAEILLVMGFACGPLILVPGLFLRRLAGSEQ